jgi:uncharacterized protein
MPGKFVITKTKGGEFMFNLKAINGQVILTSESYKTKASATGGIESVRKNAAKDTNFDRRTAKDGSPYFVLLAGNKEPIGKSEMYKSKSSSENGIRSVSKNAPTAKVADEA